MLDFDIVLLSWLRFIELSSAVNSILSFFGHAAVIECAFIEDKMVMECVEVVLKIGLLLHPERACPCCEVSVRSRFLLFGNYDSSFCSEEVATK